MIFYSQAGQTEKAIESFVKGFPPALKYDIARIQPREAFSFPWKMSRFFRVFPRCIRGLTSEIEPLGIHWENYDLVILGYQVWFLTPSLPIQAFLKSQSAEGLRGKKVITLLTCRNLWYSASCWIQERLTKLGAYHLGQVTVCELSPIWASFVTTPRWMLTGKKGPFVIFPAAGISEQEFAKLEAKGRKIADSWLVSGRISVVASELSSNLRSVALELMDRIGNRFFKIWGLVFSVLGPQEGLWQDFLLVFFRISLVTLIVTVAPVTVLFGLCAGNEGKT